MYSLELRLEQIQEIPPAKREGRRSASLDEFRKRAEALRLDVQEAGWPGLWRRNKRLYKWAIDQRQRHHKLGSEQRAALATVPGWEAWCASRRKTLLERIKDLRIEVEHHGWTDLSKRSPALYHWVRRVQREKILLSDAERAALAAIPGWDAWCATRPQRPSFGQRAAALRAEIERFGWAGFPARNRALYLWACRMRVATGPRADARRAALAAIPGWDEWCARRRSVPRRPPESAPSREERLEQAARTERLRHLVTEVGWSALSRHAELHKWARAQARRDPGELDPEERAALCAIPGWLEFVESTQLRATPSVPWTDPEEWSLPEAA